MFSKVLSFDLTYFICSLNLNALPENYNVLCNMSLEELKTGNLFLNVQMSSKHSDTLQPVQRSCKKLSHKDWLE